MKTWTKTMFMQPVIEHGSWFEVSANKGETHWVPADLLNLDYVESVRRGEYDQEELCALLADFVDGTIDDVTLVTGYGARMSADGYLDCTEWSVFDTKAKAAAYLRETYPDPDACDESDDD